MRREPNQKGVNGKPPGKTEDGADVPTNTVAEATSNTEQTSIAPESEPSSQQEEAGPTTTDGTPSTNEATADSVAEELENVTLSEATPAEFTAENESSAEEDEDDGAGEWISTRTFNLFTESLANRIWQPRATSRNTRHARTRTQIPNQYNGCCSQR